MNGIARTTQTATRRSTYHPKYGTLTYDDLLNLWSKFEDFRMNTMIVSPDMMQKLLMLSELRDPIAGLNFSGSGMIVRRSAPA
jgi:hypothetical protein